MPPLQQTCERYVAALEPILEAEELQRTKELLEDFQKAGGVGRSLQSALEERARKSENWVKPRTDGGGDDDPPPLRLRRRSRDSCLPAAVRVVGSGCVSDLSAACRGPFEPRLGLTSYGLQG